jgi:hypothetical protein
MPEKSGLKKKIVSGEFYQSARMLARLLSGTGFDNLEPEVQELVRAINGEVMEKLWRAEEREEFQKKRADRACES